MKNSGRKIIRSIISVVLALTCIFSMVASASALSWSRGSSSQKFNVHVASTSVFKKSATITIKNSINSDNAIYITVASKPSNLKVYKGTGSGVAFNTVTVYPGGSAKITVVANSFSSGLVKFNVRSAGGDFSFSATASGNGYQSMGKCL